MGTGLVHEAWLLTPCCSLAVVCSERQQVAIHLRRAFPRLVEQAVSIREAEALNHKRTRTCLCGTRCGRLPKAVAPHQFRRRGFEGKEPFRNLHQVGAGVRPFSSFFEVEYEQVIPVSCQKVSVCQNLISGPRARTAAR